MQEPQDSQQLITVQESNTFVNTVKNIQNACQPVSACKILSEQSGTEVNTACKQLYEVTGQCEVDHHHPVPASKAAERSAGFDQILDSTSTLNMSDSSDQIRLQRIESSIFFKFSKSNV